MALTPDKVLEEIDRIHKSKPIYGHPLWAGMLDDSHSLEQIRYFCKQHGILPLHNHNLGCESVFSARGRKNTGGIH